jgi:hypothetical protein
MPLAQLNVGKIVAPIDSPHMADFVARLENVNSQAESAPGFIWRLKDEGAGATSIRMFEDDSLLVNMSVWTTAESLHNFVFKNKDHADALRLRKEWFEHVTEVMVVCWNVIEGHIPTVDEAREKLLKLREFGSTESAFTLRDAHKFAS